MKRGDQSAASVEEVARRLGIALAKMSARQADIFLSIRFDKTPYAALAARHGIMIDQVTTDFARALRIWSRCLHARFPHLVWPWL